MQAASPKEHQAEYDFKQCVLTSGVGQAAQNRISLAALYRQAEKVLKPDTEAI
jgi:hypothetical protein